MRVVGPIAALLILLLGWGGAAVPGSALSMPHHAVATADCEAGAGHSGKTGHHSGRFHQGCCVMGCALSALEPAALAVAHTPWESGRVGMAADEALRDRPVSPLLRPPRRIA